jgi:predicted metal-dependent phosphoesterase TrpH
MLIDLHTHTKRYPWDSDLDPNELIERSKAAGLDGICLSEHDYFWDPEEVYALGRKHNYLVLPAIEINTDDGHALCYGLTSYVYGMHRTPELAGHVQRASGVIVAPHPYRRQMPWKPNDPDDYQQAVEKASRNQLYGFSAAMEKINGRGSEAENAFSARVIDYLGKPTTAGTDAHAIKDIGRCATEFDVRIETLEDLIEALRAGKCRAVDLVKTAT